MKSEKDNNIKLDIGEYHSKDKWLIFNNNKIEFRYLPVFLNGNFEFSPFYLSLGHGRIYISLLNFWLTIKIPDQP